MLLPLQVELVYPEQGLKLSPANVVQDLLGYRYKRRRLASREEPASFPSQCPPLQPPAGPCWHLDIHV